MRLHAWFRRRQCQFSPSLVVSVIDRTLKLTAALRMRTRRSGGE